MLYSLLVILPRTSYSSSLTHSGLLWESNEVNFKAVLNLKSTDGCRWSLNQVKSNPNVKGVDLFLSSQPQMDLGDTLKNSTIALNCYTLSPNFYLISPLLCPLGVFVLLQFLRQSTSDCLELFFSFFFFFTWNCCPYTTLQCLYHYMLH